MAPHIVPVILQNRGSENQWYIEPFCGSGAVLERVRGNRIANDANPYIIALLEAVQKGWTPPEVVTREFYNQVRDNKAAYCHALIGFVGFGCSFGGAFMKGYANPVVGREDFAAEPRALLRQRPKLKCVVFTSMDYRMLPLPANAIIYCDPPYKSTTGYTNKHSGLEPFDHEAFWQWCREKTIQGFDVYVSEFTAPPDFMSVWCRERRSTYTQTGAVRHYVEHIFKYYYRDNTLCNHRLF
jgi:Site-specific DNA methylase